jgi:hypothetical protein
MKLMGSVTPFLLASLFQLLREAISIKSYMRIRLANLYRQIFWTHCIATNQLRKCMTLLQPQSEYDH